MKFYIEQRLKYRFPSGKGAEKGTFAHRVLEILALINLRERIDPENTVLAVEEGELDITDYSIGGIIDMLAPQFPTLSKADIKFVRKCVDAALSFNSGEYDPRKQYIVSTEQMFEIEFDESWALLDDGSKFKLTGKIDLVVREDEKVLHVIDYKTNKDGPKDFYSGEIKEYQDFYDDPQLRFYHWALHKTYGDDYRFIVTIAFLNTNQFFSIPFSKEHLPRTKEMIVERFKQIRATDVPARNRSWMCTKICDFGKNDCVGTNLPNEAQESYGNVSRIGQPKCICDKTHELIQIHGVDFVEENFGKYSKEIK